MTYLGAWPFHQLAVSPNIIISLKRANELTINDVFGIREPGCFINWPFH
jgi:hypothetical protein